MKNWMKLAATTVALAMAGHAQAATVFESFPNYPIAGDTPQINCSSCGGYGAVFASFTLSAKQTLNKAFVLVNNLADPHNSMTISILNDGGNDLPAADQNGGMFGPILFQDYTDPTSVTPEPGNAGNKGNSLVEFALPNWEVGAGKYWIRFGGYSTLLPLYQTATPEHSRAVGTDYLLEGRAIVFNPANLAVGFSLNGVDVVQSAVPEPATWAMMLAGFAAAGIALRRRPALTVQHG